MSADYFIVLSNIVHWMHRFRLILNHTDMTYRWLLLYDISIRNNIKYILYRAIFSTTKTQEKSKKYWKISKKYSLSSQVAEFC